MTYLIFDTETVGTPRDYKTGPSADDNWPKMVQLAWTLQRDGKELSRGNFIIKPEGFEIPEEVAKIHGITTERALKEGYLLKDVLRYFWCALKLCDAVVCHNTGFDLNVVGSEFLRMGNVNHLENVKSIDTMRPQAAFVGLLNKWGTGYKWPSLQELHYKLFECGFDNAHDANVDINATARCFWELKKRNLILD